MSDTSTQATVRQFTMEEVGATWQSAAHALTRDGRWDEARAIVARAAADRTRLTAGKVDAHLVHEAECAKVREAVNLAQMYADGLVGVSVRERSCYGGECTVLGTFVRETATTLVYRTDEGEIKRAKIGGKARSRRGLAPAPHQVPCMSCGDHPETLHPRNPDGTAAACIHGVRYGDGWHCERCLSG